MEPAQSIDPMIWMILITATIITVAVVINKAIKIFVKLAVIAVMALFVLYFLVQAGIIMPPALPGGG